MKNIFLLFLLGFSFVGIAQDSYSLSEESKLTIDGTSTVHSWTVAANSISGKLTAANAPKTIEFEVDVAEIMSERGPTMDSKMHAALKKDEHPKVLFELREVKNTNLLVGSLTIAGTKKEVEIETQIIAEGTSMRLTGSKKITLQDFGMTPPTAMFGQIIVGDEVTVQFDLVFVKD